VLMFSTSALAESNVKNQAADHVEVRVEIAHNGSLYLNGSTTTLSQLKTFFEEEPQNPDDSVLVIADDEAVKENVLRVMNICCNHKYRRVRLIYHPNWIDKS
jgi:biopolymer transport protein ExbD